MDQLKNCVIVFDRRKNKYKDISAAISHIEVIKSAYTYRIYFKSGKSYDYRISNVQWITSPRSIDAGEHFIYRKGTRIVGLKTLLIFDNWAKLVYQDSGIETCRLNEISVVRNRASDQDVKNYLSYLIQAADIASDEITEDSSYLTNQLQNLTVSENSILSKIIANAPIKPLNENHTLIFPFDTNSAQIQAVQNAFNYDISVIEGPPGTGKTQTILNIIANAIVQNKTVAVVSGNNEATRNVQQKLDSAGLNEIGAMLGNQNNITAFFEEKHPKPTFQIDSERVPFEQFKDLFVKLQQVGENKIQLAQLTRQREELQIEQKRHIAFYGTPPQTPPRGLPYHIKSTKQLLKLAAYLEILSEKGKVALVDKIRLLFTYKVFRPKAVLENLSVCVQYLKGTYYATKIAELNQKIFQIEKQLQEIERDNVAEKFKSQSMRYLKLILNKRYQRLEGTEDYLRLFHADYAKFAERFPVTYSTTHALKSTCQRTTRSDFLFDILIIDESSQVDLASAAVALACAKRVVFVGDTMQLTHVVKSQAIRPLEELFGRFDLPKYFDYLKNSVLQSITQQYKNIPSVLLNEHYRCDPQIIDFCNKKFYNNHLIIQTKHKEGNGIKIITNESHYERNRTNERQADILTNEVLPHEKGANVGVVAPYRAQVSLLAQKISDKDIVVDTIHKFQGKERDVMVLSTVSNKIRIYDSDAKIDFLNNPNLINVAVSRAKERLYVLASNELLHQPHSLFKDLADYVEYYGDQPITPTNVYSVFDLMYGDYNDQLEPLKRKLLHISQFQSENIIATIIDNICKSKIYGELSYVFNYPLQWLVNTAAIADTEERTFAENSATHCDFIILNSLNKKPLLVIEVDGSQHSEQIQQRRDELKDSILMKFGLHVLRLKTTEIDCENKIITALNDAM